MAGLAVNRDRRQGRLASLDRVARALLLGATLLAAAGCGAPAPPSGGSSSPRQAVTAAGAPVLGIDWARAATVERPSNFEVDPSASAYTGTHPILRIPGQATMADVTRMSAGGFVAVGYSPPDWTPVAWTSPDGNTWSIHPMGTTGFTFPVAVASAADGALVAVGRSGRQPAAWTTLDGTTWQQQRIPTLGTSGVAERMTTVLAFSRGFIAGGSVGPELFERHARFWASADGTSWRPVPDSRTFANAEVRAITQFGDGFVAVGVVGTAQHPTGAVAWTSPDGLAWTRADDPAFVGGIAVAVTVAPFGGLVVVGSDLDRREAVAWTSPDGRHWSKAPSEPSRQWPGGYVWMTDVLAVGDEVIATGEDQGLQRGTATSWVSRDGAHWARATTAPVQEQGEFYAITTGGPGVIVVGSFGAPDSYVPTVWLSPGR